MITIIIIERVCRVRRTYYIYKNAFAIDKNSIVHCHVARVVETDFILMAVVFGGDCSGNANGIIVYCCNNLIESLR